jgi:MarR family transcriptional regulator, organic hydroperoxide resistance regulator
VAHNLNHDAAISDIMQSLRRIVKAIQDYSHEVSGRFGVTGPQLWALKTISREGSLPLGELSKKMYLDPSTISGVIDRLESKGYVMRDRNQEDRRVVKVRLTPTGQSLVEKAPSPAQGKMIHGLRRLSEDELSAVYHSVQKLVEIMEAQNLKVTFFFDQENAISEKDEKKPKKKRKG